MKQVWFLMLFAAIMGNIASAGDIDFTGEWIVESDNDGDSGITVTLIEGVYRPGQSREMYMPNGTSVMVSPIGIKEIAFAVIPTGTFFDFAVNGSKLTGSIIRKDTEEPILNGKISGDKITFTIKETVNENTYTYSYTGKLLDDSIQFDVRPPANGGKPFKFTVKREQ